MIDAPTPEPTPRRPHMTAGQKVVYGLRITAVRLRFIGLLVAVVLLVGYWDDILAHVERWFSGSKKAEAVVKDVEFYCPMHPHIVRDAPGNCPICGMPLSERKKGVKEVMPEGVLARVQFSPYRIAQAGIRTSTVEWRPLAREVSTVGFVEYDERRLARISARFGGRIETLAVSFTGTTVEKGKPLATVYAPEVYAAEQTFLSAAKALAEAKSATAPDAATTERAQALADAARSRLLLWGLWPEQVSAIEREAVAKPTVEVLAPLSGVVTKKAVVVGDYVMEGQSLFEVADLSTVWIKARVYEDELALVRVGAKVAATTSAFPGETFTGTVAFVDPFLDRTTRTADYRADLPNADQRLRPGMYVQARLSIPLAEVEPFRSMPKPPPGPARTVYWCPMHPEVVQDTPGECDKCGGMKLEPKEVPSGPGPMDVLSVPESAVIDTGTKRIVYVESSPGVFDAREVVLGPRADDEFPVIKGLEPGWKVATAGSFLIDAETRLNPAAASAYFGASAAPGPHAGH